MVGAPVAPAVALGPELDDAVVAEEGVGMGVAVVAAVDRLVLVDGLIGRIADDVGKNTANKCRTLLYSAMKHAVRTQCIPYNPVEAVDPIKEDPREMILWTPEEVTCFLTVARGHRLYAAFYLLVSAGLRRGELLGLQWSDRDGNLLHVRRAVVLRKNKEVISTPKTSRGTRIVALPADALEVLEQHRARQARDFAGLGLTLRRDTFLCTSEVGTLMGVRNFSRTWRTLQKQAKVPRIRLHDLRHLHATLLVENGVDICAVADRLGHADPAFTLRTYTHVLDRQRQAAAIGLHDLLRTGETGDGATGSNPLPN